MVVKHTHGMDTHIMDNSNSIKLRYYHGDIYSFILDSYVMFSNKRMPLLWDGFSNNCVVALEKFCENLHLIDDMFSCYDVKLLDKKEKFQWLVNAHQNDIKATNAYFFNYAQLPMEKLVEYFRANLGVEDKIHLVSLVHYKDLLLETQSDSQEKMPSKTIHINLAAYRNDENGVQLILEDSFGNVSWNQYTKNVFELIFTNDEERGVEEFIERYYPTIYS